MEDVVKCFGGVYAGKRVLLTGHTGFKGGWLSLWLRMLGAEVYGLSLPPPTEPSLYTMLPKSTFAQSRIGDIRELETLRESIRVATPHLVMHLAAQPIVGVSYKDPLGTFSSNALGTAYLLEALRRENSPAATVIVTSDKCYRNDNSGRAFQEADPLGGHDVYSMSKAVAELVTASWHASFFAKSDSLGPLATGRAGNVIGGGDYAEDRIVPDAVRAHVSKTSLVLRRPQATRPWQHVLESISGYLALGQRLLTAPLKEELLNFNFGPDPASERSVKELLDEWLLAWPEAFVLDATTHATYGEAARLSLDHSKAGRELGWRPAWDFHRTVRETASWYYARHEQGMDDAALVELTSAQISSYAADAAHLGIHWAL
jgi:CDP-glucose 4,6-dehydratase